jgi:mRNA interferase HicA
MKRRDLEKIARANGWTFARNGSRHDIWKKGNREEQIPRHSEINDTTAKAIADRLGQ